MRNVDPGWPVFVLVGVLVGEEYYAKTLVPRVKAFKARHHLPAGSVLHSRDIRRWEGAFTFLSDARIRESFYEDLNALVIGLRMRIFGVGIHKGRLRERLLVPVNPYHVSLSQLLSVICGPPGMPSVWRPTVARIVAESRGKREDKQLQSEYQGLRRLGLSSYGSPEVRSRLPTTVRRVFPERVEFVAKSKVVAGLELADLVAYPFAAAMVHQDWGNPAYRVIATKLRSVVIWP
jgi:hypothetical protein